MKKIACYLFVILTAACSPQLSPDNNWGSQRWVVVEMKEVPVQLSGTNRDAYLEFSPADKRISGNAGCNRVGGNYTLEKKQGIRFSEISSTKMSCPDIAFETTFLDLLGQVDRHEVTGDLMLLKDEGKVLLMLKRR